MKKIFTDAIHDAIDNNTVSDQFDTAYPASFYGTSQDDYVTGTLLTQRTNFFTGKKYYAEGDRGRIFSKLYASSQPALDSTFGSAEVAKNPSYAERLVPWSEKVGNSYRISQCFDESERIYDSCLPKAVNCFSADGASIWATYENSQYWLSPYGNLKNDDNTGYILLNANPIAGSELSNNTWTWSFPYEDKYSPQDRVVKISNVFNDITTDTATNWYPISFAKLKKLRKPKTIKSIFPLLPGNKQININDVSFRVDPSLPENADGSYRILIPSDIDLSNKSTPNNEYLTGTMSNSDMVKFLFGFGDLNNITYTSFTLNEDEDDEEQIISSSYFTGFELQNWSIPSAFAVLTIPSSSFNGSPILQSGSAPTYFNAQFDQPSGDVIVKWSAPIPVGSGNGLQAEKLYRGTKSTARIGYNEYPWVLVARQSFVTSSFDDQDQVQVYNHVSQSSYFSYSAGNSSYARGEILTGSSAVFWLSSSNPSRHWVLASFNSASYDGSFWEYFTMPDPSFLGGKTISNQKMDITASYPWKLSYQRAVSSHVSDYFRTSFSGMPGLPSSLGNVDVEIEKVFGTDVPFEGTQRIETTPQVLTDFTSSLYPPGEYQIKFSYVKTGASGSTNRIDRAFIDNVSILTFGQNQLTATFDPNNRIGYSHYPQFRQVIRDTRTSPHFPGIGLKSFSKIYKDLSKVISALDFFSTAQTPKNITISPSLSSTLLNSNLSALVGATQSQSTSTVAALKSFNKININNTSGPVVVSTNPVNPYGTAKTTTATFNVNSTRISTINRAAIVTDAAMLARLSVLDEAAKYLKSNSYGGYEIAISPVIRGWKYGIYNGLPSHSKMIFRRDRYGQFRDMLEQRIFTKFFNVTTTNISNPVRGSRPTSIRQGLTRANQNIELLTTRVIRAIPALQLTRKITSSLQSGPVTVKFVKQTVEVNSNNFGSIITQEVSPLETTSQNISTEAASAIPYFDGESKNRSDSSVIGSISKFALTTSSAVALQSALPDKSNVTINALPTKSLLNALLKK